MVNKNETSYFIMIINMVAKRYDISINETYHFLSRYKGIEFLQEFYDVEHTLNTDDVIDDVLAICSKNGGTIS